MADLFAEPSDEQRFLLEMISGCFDKYGTWPIWQYVEAALDRKGLDGETVLHSLPVIGVGSVGNIHYSYVWFDRAHVAPEMTIKLTVASALHVPARRKDGEFYIRLLGKLIEQRRWATFDPTKVTSVRVTDATVREVMPAINSVTLAGLPDALRLEPPTMNGSGTVGADGSWYIELSRQVLKYDGVDTVNSYIERVTELITPPAPQPTRSVLSPLDLVASLDYFDAVWQLEFDRPALRLFGAERVARLTTPVGSYDEFSAQLSSVAELLKNIQVSGDPKLHKTALARLGAAINDKFEEQDSAVRVREAIDTLQNISMVRNTLQHGGTPHRGVEALNNLGIPYPIKDWAAAWLAVQHHLIDALAVLREEIQLMRSTRA